MKPAGRARGRNDMDRYVLGDEQQAGNFRCGCWRVPEQG
jgi:hypothetical protein